MSFQKPLYTYVVSLERAFTAILVVLALHSRTLDVLYYCGARVWCKRLISEIFEFSGYTFYKSPINFQSTITKLLQRKTSEFYKIMLILLLYNYINNIIIYINNYIDIIIHINNYINIIIVYTLYQYTLHSMHKVQWWNILWTGGNLQRAYKERSSLVSLKIVRLFSENTSLQIYIYIYKISMQKFQFW